MSDDVTYRRELPEREELLLLLLRVPELPDELLRLLLLDELLRLLLDTLLLLDELLRLLLDTLLLLDELLRLLPDTLLLPEEAFLSEGAVLTDILNFFDELPEVRELEDEEELLREVLDEPADFLSLLTVLPEPVRRAVPEVSPLRVEVSTLLEVLLRRVAAEVAGRSAAEVLRLPAGLFTLSVRLEPARTGTLEVTAVRRFSSESTFTICLFSSREGTLTNPFLRSRRLFS